MPIPLNSGSSSSYFTSTMADFNSLSSAIAPSPSQPLPPHFALTIVTVILIVTLAVLLALILGAMIYRRRRAKNGLLICLSHANLRDNSLFAKLCSDLQVKPSKNTNLTLSKMIEQYKVFVVVFSQVYAGSPQCLDTLVKVHEWRKKTSRRVVPVFYNVDPSHVRELRGSYELLGDSSQVQKWRHAVKDISGLCGFTLIPEMASTSLSLMPSSVAADPYVEAV